jgi:pimeloyl-ACP methyl ester carboxylesterase
MSLLCYTDEGRGEPVVFLHAFPLDGRMWREQRTDLVRSLRVIVPDFAGFGASKDVPHRSSLGAHADDIAHLLDRLGIERTTLVGLSMGGYIALAFAGRYPNRLARLALADTKATPDTAEAKIARDQNIALLEKEGASALVERLVPKLLSNDASSEVVAFVRSVGASQAVPSLQSALAAMRDRPDTTPLLARLDVPAAVIVGESDVITPPADGRAMSAALPRAELEVIPGAGHLANLEAPGPFTAALTRLLARS